MGQRAVADASVSKERVDGPGSVEEGRPGPIDRGSRCTMRSMDQPRAVLCSRSRSSLACDKAGFTSQMRRGWLGRTRWVRQVGAGRRVALWLCERTPLGRR
eukprot:scaffold789_cov125-Isochrysis_galbana.AAC.4